MYTNYKGYIVDQNFTYKCLLYVCSVFDFVGVVNVISLKVTFYILSLFIYISASFHGPL